MGNLPEEVKLGLGEAEVTTHQLLSLLETLSARTLISYFQRNLLIISTVDCELYSQ
jgi:hypothetical protein